MNNIGRSLQNQVTEILKEDCESWWVKVAEVIEVAAAASNCQRLL